MCCAVLCLLRRLCFMGELWTSFGVLLCCVVSGAPCCAVLRLLRRLCFMCVGGWCVLCACVRLRGSLRLVAAITKCLVAFPKELFQQLKMSETTVSAPFSHHNWYRLGDHFREVLEPFSERSWNLFSSFWQPGSLLEPTSVSDRFFIDFSSISGPIWEPFWRQFSFHAAFNFQ